MRGTQSHQPAGAERPGIIPACAGNTAFLHIEPDSVGDHPRVCGEHYFLRYGIAIHRGSSPRVRGTHIQGGGAHVDSGIIPACAGNTLHTASKEQAPRDHPRVCGEHIMRSRALSTPVGSSPRVRGTQNVNRGDLVQVGIIPACAGNTGERHPRCSIPWDHPRVCGEHINGYRIHKNRQGSSPRVRGTRRSRHLHVRQHGIIPACAGNTNHKPHMKVSHWDHPRVCGEHLQLDQPQHPGDGSSPRVRGTPSGSVGGVVGAGIIPACAGNTFPHRMRQRSTGDHPRVCGEHGECAIGRHSGEGSSPRVRGTRVNFLRPVHAVWIIPACAGNTLRK